MQLSAENSNNIRLHCACVALIVASATLIGAPSAQAQEPSDTVRLDASLTLRRFEQQVKTEVGGARGERLVEETELSMGAMSVWHPLPYIGIGGFARYDVGARSAGRFTGFDANNEAVVEGEVGGGFSELWLGPLVRGQWRTLFVEVGYGAYGRRWDDGRDDLLNTKGSNKGPLETSSTVAWLLGAGGGLPLTDSLELVFRLEYRVRYYVGRDGAALADEMAHGTQSWAPLIGVAYYPL